MFINNASDSNKGRTFFSAELPASIRISGKGINPVNLTAQEISEHYGSRFTSGLINKSLQAASRRMVKDGRAGYLYHSIDNQGYTVWVSSNMDDSPTVRLTAQGQYTTANGEHTW